MNPHCPECKLESIEKKYCNGCDTLQVENDRLRNENSRLLDRLLIPVESVASVRIEEMIPIPSRHVPLSVLRERAEREDRILADKLRKEAPKPDAVINKEKEMKELELLQNELHNA